MSVNLESYYEDYYFDVMSEVLGEFKNRNKGDKQYWNLLELSTVQRIWTDFVTSGRIGDSRGMDKIVGVVLRNIAKLQINTELAGHTQVDPVEAYLEDYDFTQEDYEEFFPEYIEDEDGQLKISDYGLEPLVKLAGDLLGVCEPEEQIFIVDQILNVVHPRSDLSKLFIKGGSHSLDILGE